MAKKTKKGPKQYIQDRLDKCRAAMAEKDVSAYLLTNRMDGFYLTGFTGEDSAVLITPRQVHVITDGRFKTSSEAEVSWARRHFRKKTIEEEIGKVAKSLKLTSMHIQPNMVTLEQQKQLRKHCKPVKLANAPKIIDQLRLIKDREEIKQTRQAVRLAQEAFQEMCTTIKVGQTEREIAARLEYEMARRGSQGPAFPTIVAIGPNAALPHAVPGSKKVTRRCAILFDWGATYNFYRSDLTRVVFVGSIPPRIRKIYGIVLEAQEKAIAALKPGEAMCDMDAVARQHIKKCGYGKNFGHSLGHGVGLDIHESPRLSWMSDEKLEAGMLVTVEPGIYLPGVGGVRIEDDVLITSKGYEVLSSLPKDIDSAVI